MKAVKIIVLLALGLVASVALLVGVGLYLNGRAAAAATAFCSKVSPGMPEPEALAAGAASGARHFPGTNEHRFRFQGWVFNAAVCRVTTADGRVVRAVVEETGTDAAAPAPAAMIVSVTRLHLRSLRYLLPFALHAGRARRQAAQSPGCLGVQVRKTRGLAFWTLSLWADEPALRQYLSTGPHRAAMPKLAHWCDTAAVAHWTQEAAPPSWQEAAARLAATGRLSRVEHPSAPHREGRIDVS